MPSRSTRAILVGALVLAALAVICPPTAAQQTDRAQVTLQLGTTYRKAYTAPHVLDVTLGVGETRTLRFELNCGKDGGYGLKSSDDATKPISGVAGGIVGGGGAVPPSPPARAAGAPVADPGAQYTWTAQVRIVAIGTDNVTLETDWNRAQSNGGSFERVAGDVRTIKLMPGERHVLDFVNQPENAIANIVLEIAAARVEDPANANVTYEYDLWVVHEPAAGQKITRRVTTTGRNAQSATFAFEPLSFPLSANDPLDGATGRVKLGVAGTISGRLQPDGSIEIALHSGLSMGSGDIREFVKAAGPMAQRWFVSGSGDKFFTVKPDETTAIEYPLPKGSMSWGKMQVTDPRPGVSVANGGVRLDDEKYLAGSKTSLLVTVHRRQ